MLPVTSISPSIFISDFFFSSTSTNLLTEFPCYYIRAVLEQRRGYFRHPFSLERKKGAVSFANMCNQQIALMYEYATKPEGYMFFFNVCRDHICSIYTAVLLPVISKVNKVLICIFLKAFMLLMILCY